MSRRRRIQPAATGDQPASQASPARRVPKTPTRRHPGRLVIGLAGLLAVVGVGAWLLFGRPDPPPPPPAPDTSKMFAPVARMVEDARRAVEQRPRDAAAWGAYGKILDAHHLYDDAAVAYAQALALEPTNFIWAYLLAVVEDFRGSEGPTILARFESAIALNSGYPPVHYRHGDALTRQGQMPEAAAAYRRAIELDPNFAMAHRSLGQVLLGLGETEAAIEHLERAAAIEPNDSIVHTSLGQAYSRVGLRTRGEAALARAAGLPQRLGVPDPLRYDVDQQALNPTALGRRYQEAMHAGNWPAAIEDLETLIEMFPQAASYQLQLGICRARNGETALAERHLAKAIALDGELIDAHQELADLTQNARRTGEAARHMRRVVELAPDRDDARARLASLLGMTNDLDGAIAQFEELARRRTPDAEAHHNWGTVLMRRGRHREAAEHFRAALKESPNNPGTLYNLGLSLEQLGRRDEALANFRESAALDPAGPAAKRLAGS